MSKSHVTNPDASLLAEVVASGLHDLAQPLTKAQWGLESAVMHMSGTGQLQTELSDALDSLEGVVASLNILRDLIRPFRMATEYKLQSVREALLKACEEQQDVLRHEGVQVMFHEGCAEGTTLAPQGFMDCIAFRLFNVLRRSAPVSVEFNITETADSLLLLASLECAIRRDDKVPLVRSYSTIRSYIEVLRGEFSLENNESAIRIVLPKEINSI